MSFTDFEDFVTNKANQVKLFLGRVMKTVGEKFVAWGDGLEDDLEGTNTENSPPSVDLNGLGDLDSNSNWTSRPPTFRGVPIPMCSYFKCREYDPEKYKLHKLYCLQCLCPKMTLYQTKDSEEEVSVNKIEGNESDEMNYCVNCENDIDTHVIPFKCFYCNKSPFCIQCIDYIKNDDLYNDLYSGVTEICVNCVKLLKTDRTNE
jgi:hypothetical protein